MPADSTVKKILNLAAQSNAARVNFLQIDVTTALIFSGIALESGPGQKRQRNYEQALKGYRTVKRLLSRVELTDEEAKLLSEKLERLKGELMQLERKPQATPSPADPRTTG